MISQHAEGVAMLWVQRAGAVAAPHYSLADLAKLDGRIEAHLDGLRVAGEEGWRAVLGELAWEEPGEVFMGVVLACEGGDEERLETVLKAAEKGPELAGGVISGLGWLEVAAAWPWIERLLKSEGPMRRRMGIGAAAVHRRDPGEALRKAVADEPVVRSRALRAAGVLGRRDLAWACVRELGSADPACRFWGAWSAAVLGEAAGVKALRETAEAGGERAEQAADLAARRLPPGEAVAWQRKLAKEKATARLAAKVAGAIGDPAAAGWLLEMMADDEVSRPAGEAFTLMTGVDLAHDDLERDRPAGVESGPTESPEDENVAMDPDEDLPWADAALVKKWWSSNRGRFAEGARHLLGKPMAVETLNEALRIGKQRVRRAAALELALRQGGGALFEVRARGDRQRKVLHV